jgi:hypothetical protein
LFVFISSVGLVESIDQTFQLLPINYLVSNTVSSEFSVETEQIEEYYNSVIDDLISKNESFRNEIVSLKKTIEFIEVHKLESIARLSQYEENEANILVTVDQLNAQIIELERREIPRNNSSLTEELNSVKVAEENQEMSLIFLIIYSRARAEIFNTVLWCSLCSTLQ